MQHMKGGVPPNTDIVCTCGETIGGRKGGEPFTVKSAGDDCCRGNIELVSTEYARWVDEEDEEAAAPSPQQQQAMVQPGPVPQRVAVTQSRGTQTEPLPTTTTTTTQTRAPEPLPEAQPMTTEPLAVGTGMYAMPEAPTPTIAHHTLNGGQFVRAKCKDCHGHVSRSTLTHQGGGKRTFNNLTIWHTCGSGTPKSKKLARFDVYEVVQ
jgi:hypothetical protein